MRNSGLTCPGCGLEHTVDEDLPADGGRRLRCFGDRGGCDRRWPTTEAQERILDQMKRLEEP